MIRRLLERAPLRLLFYVCLDVVVGAVIYLISVGEAGLSSGQLAIRILTAMGLASAIIGGPDIMLYWQESGRRIKAEEERDTVAKERDAERDARIAAERERDEVVQLRNKAFELRDNAVRERDQAAANASETQQQMQGQIDELRTQIERLQSQRGSRRSRRRRLRNNEQ